MENFNIKSKVFLFFIRNFLQQIFALHILILFGLNQWIIQIHLPLHFWLQFHLSDHFAGKQWGTPGKFLLVFNSLFMLGNGLLYWVEFFILMGFLRLIVVFHLGIVGLSIVIDGWKLNAFEIMFFIRFIFDDVLTYFDELRDSLTWIGILKFVAGFPLVALFYDIELFEKVSLFAVLGLFHLERMYLGLVNELFNFFNSRYRSHLVKQS